ncbi:MAG TPA: hypothetical protein DCP71_13325 [Verrucomicrobiales bacterium]|nr:hypothetical protein [Verrucomicrobiales bacterium]
MKLDIAENQLATAFLMIGAYSTNLPEQYANLVVRHFNDVLGNDINIMLSNDHPGEVRAKARNKITKLIVKALDGLEKKGERKSHGSAITLEMADGKKQLLAWVILEHARKLVEATQELPTKGQIKQSVITAFPTTQSVSSAQWAKAFKDAGLANLQRIGKW